MMRIALARASLQRHASRTLLATLGVAVAMAMLLDMVMLSTGMHESFKRLLVSRGFQIRLSPRGTLPFDTDATIPDAAAITRTVHLDPDVDLVSPVLGGSMHVDAPRGSVTSFALGLIPSQQGDYVLDSGADAVAPDRMVVNEDFLRASGARVGDTVAVSGGYDAQLRASAGTRRMVIAGRARFLYMSAGQICAAMPLTTLQDMEGPALADHASLFMVKARSDSSVEQVRAWIAAHVPRVTVISTETALAQVDQRLSYFRQLAFILGAVSLGVGFLLVATLMTVSVNERVSEIGVMRAIGVSRANVVRQVMLEGLTISLTGGILGLGLGLVTARYLNSILSDFPGLPVAIDFFLFQPKDAWAALGLLTLSGIAAGVYPAWRASSLPIATTLRREATA